MNSLKNMVDLAEQDETEDTVDVEAIDGKLSERKGIGFKTVKNIFTKQKKIALIIDAPNILRRPKRTPCIHPFHMAHKGLADFPFWASPLSLYRRQGVPQRD